MDLRLDGGLTKRAGHLRPAILFIFCCLFLLVAASAGSAGAAPGPVPEGLSAADWGQITAMLPAPAAPAQQAYLKASNAEANDNFGRSVAVSGETVIMGAWSEDGDGAPLPGNNNASAAGAAYVFDVPPPSGTITIVKDADPEDDTEFSFTEDITSGGGVFTLTDPADDTETFSDVPGGSYTVTEDGETGWTLDDITCDDANSTGDTGTRAATINLEDGETITCTFSNIRDTGAITIIKEATPADDTHSTSPRRSPAPASPYATRRPISRAMPPCRPANTPSTRSCPPTGP